MMSVPSHEPTATLLRTALARHTLQVLVAVVPAEVLKLFKSKQQCLPVRLNAH